MGGERLATDNRHRSYTGMKQHRSQTATSFRGGEQAEAELCPETEEANLKSLSQPDTRPDANAHIEADPGSDKRGNNGNGGLLPTTEGLVGVAGFQPLECAEANSGCIGEVRLAPSE